MIGRSTAAATSAKCRATASELSLAIRGGLIITAPAPAARARRVYSMQVRRPSAVVPATTGTRPLTCASTVSSTRSRSGSVRRATSPVTPSAVNPSTPSARNRSRTRVRLSGSMSPPDSNGVGRTEKTPPNRTRHYLRRTQRRFVPFVSFAREGLPVGRPYRDEDVAALTVEEHQHRLVARAPDCLSQLVDRVHRAAVDRLNDIARLNAGIGRPAVRIHVFDDETARVPRRAHARRELRRQRRHRYAERGSIVAIYALAAAAAGRRLLSQLVQLHADVLFDAVADDDHIGGRARSGLRHTVTQRVQVVHLHAVERFNQVALLQPGPDGGAARRHRADTQAARILQPEPLRDVRRQLLHQQGELHLPH